MRRAKRITADPGSAVGGVERLGAGIGTVGEGVTKLGDLTKKVPLVGAGVGKLGEGLTKAGESIHALPRSRRRAAAGCSCAASSSGSCSCSRGSR